MRLIDADKLPITETWALVNGDGNSPKEISFAPLRCVLMKDINKASTIEEIETLITVTMDNSLITESRNTAIKMNLPLYFVYYEETGIFEAYVTKTKELFEKRHCAKHMSDYEFEKLARQYLDDYSDWKGD